MQAQFSYKIITLPEKSPKNKIKTPHVTPIVISKGDSVASHHYWRLEDQHCLTRHSLNTTIQVELHNASKIGSTVQGQKPLHNKLSTTAKKAIVLPTLKSSSLISLGQLYDDNFNTELDKKRVMST